MLDLPITTPYLAANAAALALFLLSGRWPRVTRAALVALFGAASITALATALDAPARVLALGRLAPIASYRAFAEGPLAEHLLLLPSAMALVLALVATGLAIGGNAARVATTSGIVFLLLILPFGIGTAFPAPLFLAAGVWLVSRSPGLLDDAIFVRHARPRHASPWRGPPSVRHA